MRAIQTETTNFTLKGNNANVYDLPVTRVQFQDGQIAVESCWELSDQDLLEIIKTRRLYFCCLAPTHAPCSLDVYSVLSGKCAGQQENNVEGGAIAE